MNKYHQNIFYDARFSLDKKKEICDWAKERCKIWRVDKLDIAESWARQEIEMSYEDIMKLLNDKCHFTIIHRRGYEEWKEEPNFETNWCLEVGFSTMGLSPEYFLWVYCDEKYVDDIVREFKLEIL